MFNRGSWSVKQSHLFKKQYLVGGWQIRSKPHIIRPISGSF